MHMKKAIKYIFNILMTAYLISTSLWTILEIVNYYATKEIFKGSSNFWVIFIVIPVTLAIIYVFAVKKTGELKRIIKEIKAANTQDNEIIRFYRNIIADSIEDIQNNHSDALLADVEKAKTRKNWQEVIRLCKHGSRLSLMLSKYNLRIKYGEYIVDAAKAITDIETEAMALIDCFGWSYVKLNDDMNAKTSINNGLELIKESKSQFALVLKCKAYRHLAGISIKNQDKNEAQNYRELFEKTLKKLKGYNKKIMQASLYLLDGDIYKLRAMHEDAKRKYEEARKLFLKYNDEERAVKTRYKLGNINNIMGQHPQAIEQFLFGFYESERIGRIDELFKNCEQIYNMLKDNETSKIVNDKLSEIRFKQELEKYDIIIETDINFYIESYESLYKQMSA